jgi:hypothetical protein
MNMGAKQNFVTRTALKKPASKIGRTNFGSRRVFAETEFVGVIELTFGRECTIRRVA